MAKLAATQPEFSAATDIFATQLGADAARSAERSAENRES